MVKDSRKWTAPDKERKKHPAAGDYNVENDVTCLGRRIAFSYRGDKSFYVALIGSADQKLHIEPSKYTNNRCNYFLYLPC